MAFKLAFQEKQIAARCSCSVGFFHYNLLHEQNRQVTSCCECVPHSEWFELKLGMGKKEGLLTNFPMFHGDPATGTIFSQHCRKTYLDRPCIKKKASLLLILLTVGRMSESCEIRNWCKLIRNPSRSSYPSLVLDQKTLPQYSTGIGLDVMSTLLSAYGHYLGIFENVFLPLSKMIFIKILMKIIFL